MVWGEGLVPWAIFLLSAAVIVYAGTKLSRYGDQIADLTGLGGLWIGVVLMASATSLPEIFTDVSAALMHAPDLAAGDLFGSNMANMLILGIIDLMLWIGCQDWRGRDREHAVAAPLHLRHAVGVQTRKQQVAATGAGESRGRADGGGAETTA
jgi:cation:H+ antiporter